LAKAVINTNFNYRLKKKDNDLLNANDRVHALEDELRGIGSKMSKLEHDHHKVIQELNVSPHLLPELNHIRGSAQLGSRNILAYYIALLITTTKSAM
jgi:hypothetical protein